MQTIDQSTVSQLKHQGDFLSLSRQQPTVFSHTLSFDIEQHTQVTVLAEGIIMFEPNTQSDSDIVISCGVHGNETAPIEICDQLVKKILTNQLQVKQRVLFLFSNLPAMDIAQRFVEENMNRLFSGAHAQLAEGLQMNQERLRAQQLEQAVAQFYLGNPNKEQAKRFHYDLHTAIRASKNDKFAVYPFQNGKHWDTYQLQFLLACGVNTILLSGSPTTTFSYFSVNEFAAQAFTVELGKVQPFGQNDMQKFAQVIQTLTRLITGAELGLKPYDQADFLIYKVNQIINKQHPDFKLHFAEDTPNFTDFAQGQVLASEPGKQYLAQEDGEAIVFPNADVAIGQRALLTVVPTTI